MKKIILPIFSKLLFVYFFIYPKFVLTSELKKLDGIDLTLTAHPRMGFFAELNYVFCPIVYYEKNGIKKLTIDWSQNFFPYKDDLQVNGFDLYFELKKEFDTSNNLYEKKGSCWIPGILHDQLCLDRWVNYENYLEYRKFFNQKFHEYLSIKQPILDETEKFYDNNMKNHFCIGVHVRFAIDHRIENPEKKAIPLRNYINEASKQIKIHSNKNPIVFLATDCDSVINEFKKHFDASMIVYIDAFRSKNNYDPHTQDYGEKPGYFGGKTALIDCLLLSKCNTMVHSHSNVCQWATFFNPYLKSIFLPKGLKTNPCAHPNAPFEKIAQS